MNYAVKFASVLALLAAKQAHWSCDQRLRGSCHTWLDRVVPIYASFTPARTRRYSFEPF